MSLATKVSDLAARIAAELKSVRGVRYTLTSNRSLSNNNSAQSIFGVETTLAPGRYDLEMVVGVYSTGTTSNSLGLSFGGTAVFGAFSYHCVSEQNATSLSTVTAANLVRANSAANVAVTTAVASQTYRNLLVRGTFTVTTAGTINPQLTYSAAPGAAATVVASSFVQITPTADSVGAWS